MMVGMQAEHRGRRAARAAYGESAARAFTAVSRSCFLYPTEVSRSPRSEESNWSYDSIL